MRLLVLIRYRNDMAGQQSCSTAGARRCWAGARLLFIAAHLQCLLDDTAAIHLEGQHQHMVLQLS